MSEMENDERREMKESKFQFFFRNFDPIFHSFCEHVRSPKFFSLSFMSLSLCLTFGHNLL